MVAGYSSLCRVESCGVSLFTEGTLDVCSGAGTGLLLKGFRAEHQRLAEVGPPQTPDGGRSRPGQQVSGRGTWVYGREDAPSGVDSEVMELVTFHLEGDIWEAAEYNSQGATLQNITIAGHFQFKFHKEEKEEDGMSRTLEFIIIRSEDTVIFLIVKW